MKSLVACGAVGLVLCSLAGCDSGWDGVIKDRIRCWNEAADVFATIRDEQTALKARPKLNAVLDRIAELDRKGKTVAPASEEKVLEVRMNNQEAVKAANDRINEQMERAASVPGGAEVVSEFNYKVRQGLN